jgi:hypothetical protein
MVKILEICEYGYNHRMALMLRFGTYRETMGLLGFREDLHSPVLFHSM